MAAKNRGFNPEDFLATIGEGRRLLDFRKKQIIFSQGDASDGVFYVQKGKVRLTVLSKSGKEATLGILGTGDFFGEGCLTTSAHGNCDGDDRVHSSASRAETHDASASRGALIF